MLRTLSLCLRVMWERHLVLVHARSYIPAAVALALNRATGVPFIFDMRALWPEELITSQRLRRGSMTHRVLVAVERACLKAAAGVVSLTHAAVRHLNTAYPLETAAQRIRVIPTCADLDRFVPGSATTADRRVYSCIGTLLSGWFLVEWLGSFIRAATTDHDTRVEIITRDDPRSVRSALGIPPDIANRVDVFAAQPHLVHQHLQHHTASVMFYAADNQSELGRSPTRMAEVLGCGIPVVASEGVGDVAEIVRKYKVGVLVAGPGQAEMSQALASLDELIRDPDTVRRCRRAAEEVFSLSAGTEAYDQLYRDILGLPEHQASATEVVHGPHRAGAGMRPE